MTSCSIHDMCLRSTFLLAFPKGTSGHWPVRCPQERGYSDLWGLLDTGFELRLIPETLDPLWPQSEWGLFESDHIRT